MSIRSSSFDDLTDLESVKSEVTSTFEDVHADEVEDLKYLKIAELEARNQKLVEEMGKMKLESENSVEIAGLHSTIRKLTEEMEMMKEKESCDEESILSCINGTWKIVSSIGMDEYIRKWKPADPESDYAFFQNGSKYFHFDQETKMLTSSTILGTRKQLSTDCKLGEKTTAGTKKFDLFVKNNALVSVVLGDNGEEYMRYKRFVKNGQLHVVIKRFGLNCTRVYERIEARAQEVSGISDDLSEKVVALTSELEQVKKDLEEKSKEVSTLQTELLMKKEKLDTVVTATSDTKRDCLGHWELQNPSPCAPTKVLIQLEGGKLVERNNGSFDKKYICVDADAEYSWSNGIGIRTFYSQEQDKLITESIFEDGQLRYYLKRWTEKGVLKVTRISLGGERLEFIYKQIEL